jgi:CDP-glucose 4,6-dehydratase
MSKSFWKNKKVLITGYGGFLGSHLTRALLNNHAKICGLDIKTCRLDTILSRGELDRITVIKGSVENLSLLTSIIQKQNIEFIFHIAAEALVGRCFKNPLKAFSTNIKGTWNILEAARHSQSIKAVVVASSDKAYGDQVRLPYRETFPLLGRHPYDVSKSCADLLAYTYFHTYGVPVCVTRCGNIFGPGDFNFSRIIPETVRSIINGKTLIIRSDGKFTRDYIYIDDIISAYLLLAQKMARLGFFGQAFNFSNELPISVIELVKIIYKLVGEKENYKILNQAHFEIKHQYLSSSKARKVIGWRPKFSLEKGLRKTIYWYSKLFQK